MKVAVISANGKVGQLVTNQLLEKNYDVTVIVRNENKTKSSNAIIKDVFSLTKEDLKGFDVVVSAFGVNDMNIVNQIPESIKKLIELLEGTKTRLMVVGGAGSLYVDDNKTLKVIDTKDFPDFLKPLAKAHNDGLDLLKESKNLNWLYISPACDFRYEAPLTNKYKIGTNQVILNKNNESVISYQDYSKALVDEIANNKYHNQQITFVEE